MPIKGGGFQKSSKASDEVPTSSLADIAFLLLIFFMVTTVFQSDRDRPIEWARAQAAEKIDEKQKNILNIWMERDGVVYINDQVYSMDEVTTIVAPLYAASERALVVSIVAERDVTYQVMDQLQEELVTAGVVRVVFEAVDSLPLGSPSADVPSILDQGLTMVLRAVRVVYEALESLAARSPPDDDDVDALLDRGLGIVLPSLTPDGQSRPAHLDQVEVNPRNLLHITVQPSGLVDLRRGESLQAQTVSPEVVKDVWLHDAGENPYLIADVRTHPDAPYRYMLEVLEALHSAGAERISLRVLEL